VAVRLKNENDPKQTLSLTHQAWYALLDLAEAYGWHPIGTLLPGEWDWLELELNGFAPVGIPHISEDGCQECRLVIIEDALTLADALEEAFLDYEPSHVPASFYLFEPDDMQIRLRPAIGTINTAAEFFRQGAFWVEIYQNGRT
jgi:hypothetical protein